MRKMRGFTLVELMIVVALLGVLSAIAIPMYKGYIEHSRNSEATTNLQNLLVLEEQAFQDEGEYVDGADTAALIAAMPAFKPGDPAKLFFNYKVEVPNPNTAGVAASFLATATRKNDATKIFTLDDRNYKSW